jgi:hypothetical protein
MQPRLNNRAEFEFRTDCVPELSRLCNQRRQDAGASNQDSGWKWRKQFGPMSGAALCDLARLEFTVFYPILIAYDRDAFDSG